jgi:hypothetical protein
MIGTTSFGISHHLRDIYTSHAGVSGILLHVNGMITMAILKL